MMAYTGRLRPKGNLVPRAFPLKNGWGTRRWGTHFFNAKALGTTLPKRGTFVVRFQVHERVGISLVEVYKRVAKSVIWVCKRAQKG